MKPTPPGWPRMSASVHYDDPHAAIAWLEKAFGFEVRVKVEGEDGVIHHSELVFGDALVMVGGTNGKEPWQRHDKSPKSLDGAITQALAIFVDDVDRHHARAVAAGATIVREPKTDDYGPEYWSDRTYGALDPEQHLWWFMQRISTSPEQEKFGKKP
jgi:uncharacterized glyoxalase superfamily protein PhnB